MQSRLGKLLLASGVAAGMAAFTGHAFADAVTLQMWTNATADPLKGIFQKAADGAVKTDTSRLIAEI